MELSRRQRPHFFLIAGHIVECFDNTIYGFFAVLLAPLFFPTQSPEATLLASYGAFFAGFFSRPLGAFFFGHLGDKKGRKVSLLYSMALVGIPTTIIGFLPTYDTIGFIAPLILILCRLAQGFFYGGEFAGANLYISENFHPGSIGKGTSILIFSGVMGAVLATLLGAIVTLDIMPSWAWRVPFLIGGFSAYIVFAIRRKMVETVAFSQLKESEKLKKSPWKILLKHHKTSLFIACLIAGLTIAPLYSATVLGNKLFRELGYTSSECMIFNAAGMLVDGVGILFFGYMADRIGFHRQMIFGTFLIAIIPLFSFYPLDQDAPSLLSILWFIFSLVLSGGVINACAMPYIASYFPTNCRFSGLALSTTLGQAVFGGTMPLIGSYLLDNLGTRMAPAFWITALSFMAFLLIQFLEKPKYLHY